jgi:hypothetical protein
VIIINLSGEALLSISVEKPLLSISVEKPYYQSQWRSLVINLSENSIIRSSVIIFIHTNFLYIFRDCTCGGNNKRVFDLISLLL